MIQQLITLVATISIDPNTVNVPKGTVSPNTISNALHLVFGTVGAIAVIVITVAGLQYVMAQGNPQSAARAKDAILYALVGLVISILGYGIVTFVVNGVAK